MTFANRLSFSDQ